MRIAIVFPRFRSTIEIFGATIPAVQDMFQLFFLFTVIPFVELWLLFHIGEDLGIANTLALVLGTGIVGAALARWQGFQAIKRLQREMSQGMVPAGAIGDGFLIFAAGLLLITPGILTDIVGLSLLVPPVRTLILIVLKRWVAKNFKVQTHTEQQDPRQPSRPTTIIDAKVVDSQTDS